MALTAEGRSLTESHRRQQLAIAARAERAARALWPRLRVSDLDMSTPAWMGVNVAAVRGFFNESVDLAAAYVTEYRAVEAGASVGRVVEPSFNAALQRETLLLAGPVRVKLLVGRGASPSGAHGAALNKFAGMARRQVLSGGRQLVDLTTKADRNALGWRRVTDGDPCTFCAMLASRGPVYGSAGKADSVGGTGLRYHGHCGCTAEIVYGEWRPSESEQRYINEYEKAAQEANDAGQNRTQDTVLHRMRNNGVFRDSPLSRNK
jgi:hypothetical protein